MTYRFLLLGLLSLANLFQCYAQNFTDEDRARLIRTETRLEALEQRMTDGFSQIDKRFEQVDKRFEQIDKRFEQVDKRFEQADKRFEDNFTYMGYLITLFGGMFASIIAFALWDRKTMIRPFERKVTEIESEIMKIKKDKTNGKIIASLRELAKSDIQLAEILKSNHLL